MDITDYIGKAERQLNNKEHYLQLSKDQTTGNRETVNNVIDRSQNENLIIKNIAEGLKLLHLGHVDSTLKLKYINKVILEDQ